MNRLAVPLVLAALGGIAAAVASAFRVDQSVIDVIVLGTALAVGDLFELRPANRAPISVGYALTIVLLRAATPVEFVVVVVAAAAAAAALRATESDQSRVAYGSELITSGLAAGLAFHLTIDSFSGHSRTGTLVALMAAAVIEIAVADIALFVRERRIPRLRARGADVALVSSGILMAVGYGGLAGSGRLGLWAPALFCIPLLMAWYSFELLLRSRRTFLQTVQALGIAPELSDLAPTGHVERVALLAVEIGRELAVNEAELRDLNTAAWLHHLGAVCLDEPNPGTNLNPSDVARAGAEMLRSTQVLATAGDIVAAEPLPHRPPGGDLRGSASTLLSQVLKVASAYDELTGGDESRGPRAVEALYSEPASTFDVRVLDALEAVTARRQLTTR